MTVPTHNLYDFVYQATEKQFCMLYFFPFGEKNIKNIKCFEMLKEQTRKIPKDNLLAQKLFSKTGIVDSLDHTYRTALQPVLFCHDQEPLYFDLYNDYSIYSSEKQAVFGFADNSFYPHENFNLRWIYPHNMQSRWILLHSELNSENLRRYEDTGRFIGAYYWNHAILSLDWYRFAEHDTELTYNKNSKNFLIYCRDTTGLRTYRKDFMEMLKTDQELYSCSQIGSFVFDNVDSNSSAEYDSYDISHTDLSVVLETVFDDRIHLTEKTCRALATGHPFLLAAGPGSLQLLKKYGFKTFGPYLDESYDRETDSKKRLQKIISAMKSYSSLDKIKQQEVLEKCREIAKFNKAHFFSGDFFRMLEQELKDNIKTAYQNTQKNMFDINRFFLDLDYKKQKANTKKQDHYWRVKIKELHCDFFTHLKQGGTIEDYEPPELD